MRLSISALGLNSIVTMVAIALATIAAGSPLFW